MNINIIIEGNLDVDLLRLKQVLNEQTKSIKFEVYKNNFKIDDVFFVFPQTHKKIYDQFTKKESSAYFNFLFTDLPYLNNYYFEGYDNFVPFSLSDWDFMTNLPIENGILYFIISYLSRQLETEEFRHQDNTGCIYDFLRDKRGVDVGMRQASFCKNCLETIEKKVLSERDYKLLEDLKIMMNFLSNSSKWNKNILEKTQESLKIKKTKRQSIVEGEINVVIASPADLYEERELLINKLERKFRIDKHEDKCQHRLKVHAWEDLPSQNGYAQDIINSSIIEKMDIIVAIFKHKLGTPIINPKTGRERSLSGTAEEILFALDSNNTNNPLGMVYYYSTPPYLSLEAENFDKIKKEWDQLKSFKESIQNKVLYKPFKTKEELIEIVSIDLMKNIIDYFGEKIS